MNILVLHSQVPFTRGGAEVLVEGLVSALREYGHQAEIVALPVAWNPVDSLLTTALSWSLLDLTSFNGRPVDLVICTKYPTWAVNHPNKSLWLIHQHRQAYDLHGTALSEFTPDSDSQAVRRAVRGIDQRGIGECGRRYAISKNVANRLKQYCGIGAEPLYPPVPREGLHPVAYEPFVLSVSRIDDAKRVDRVLDAWRHVRSDLKLVIAGDGPNRGDLEEKARRWGLGERVSILGRVSDDLIHDLYNRCRAVYYAPVDEDYGYAAVEALRAGKPVITAADSGGVLEFVEDGQTGLISSLEPSALAETVDRLADEPLARKLGANGPERTRDLAWSTVVEKLTGVGRND